MPEYARGGRGDVTPGPFGPYRSKRRTRAGGAHASQPSVTASRSARAETFGSWIRTAEYPSKCEMVKKASVAMYQYTYVRRY
jgi:hypothetical protein